MKDVLKQSFAEEEQDLNKININNYQKNEVNMWTFFSLWIIWLDHSNIICSHIIYLS